MNIRTYGHGIDASGIDRATYLYKLTPYPFFDAILILRNFFSL